MQAKNFDLYYVECRGYLKIVIMFINVGKVVNFNKEVMFMMDMFFLNLIVFLKEW